jgi:Kef-type K+ transport system membrane component KefB
MENKINNGLVSAVRRLLRGKWARRPCRVPWIRRLLIPALFMLLIPLVARASDGVAASQTALIAETFLWMAVLLMVSRLGLLAEKIGQPPVLGEIVAGVVLGNLALVGINWFEPAKVNQYLGFLAEFGVVLLLFRIGLESNIKEMGKVGVQAFVVACIGVILPFLFGTLVVGNLFFAESSFATKLFIGASMTATSVGITARVFKDLKKLHIGEAKIVLGAAVIDDVLGLLILAVVSSVATSGSLDFLNILWLAFKAFAFLAAAVVVGQFTAPHIGKFLSKIHNGEAMKLSFALAFALFIAYLSSVIGLAPIVGAFAAGLVMDSVHFKSFGAPAYVKEIKEKLKHAGKDSAEVDDVLKTFEAKHVEELVDSLGHIFIPLFFLITGMQVKLEVLFNPTVLIAAIVLTAFAFLGKILAGFGAYGKGMNKVLVGFGMIPRGEVGLIFANVGKGLGVVSDELFSIIIVMVMFTTLFTPPILAMILKRHKEVL